MITPRMTEKAYTESTKHTYVFYVPQELSKQAIAKAVADEYKVTVVDVRTIIRKGKKARFSRGKHAYPGTTYRQDHKIAYVTIKEGEKIPIFDEPEAEKTAETEEKPKKAAKEEKGEKKAKRTTKKAEETKEEK